MLIGCKGDQCHMIKPQLNTLAQAIVSWTQNCDEVDTMRSGVALEFSLTSRVQSYSVSCPTKYPNAVVMLLDAGNALRPPGCHQAGI